jgi:hypothetical protein
VGVGEGGTGVAVEPPPPQSCGKVMHQLGVGVGVGGRSVGVAVGVFVGNAVTATVGVGVGEALPAEVVKSPSSASMLPMGLYTRVFPSVEPPQRMPYRVTLGPVPPKTGDPLSPAPTI